MFVIVTYDVLEMAIFQYYRLYQIVVLLLRNNYKLLYIIINHLFIRLII